MLTDFCNIIKCPRLTSDEWKSAKLSALESDDRICSITEHSTLFGEHKESFPCPYLDRDKLPIANPQYYMEKYHRSDIVIVAAYVKCTKK